MFLNSLLGRKKKRQHLGLSLRKVSIQGKKERAKFRFVSGRRCHPAAAISINNSRWISLYPVAFSMALCSDPIDIFASLLRLNAALLKNYYPGRRCWAELRQGNEHWTGRQSFTHFYIIKSIFFLILIILLFDSALMNKLIFSLWIFSALFLRWKSRICTENLGKKS